VVINYPATTMRTVLQATSVTNWSHPTESRNTVPPSSTSEPPMVNYSDRLFLGCFPQGLGTRVTAAYDLRYTSNYASSPPPNVVEAPTATANASSRKTPRCLIKLQPYDGSESLETFLAKFQRMARYLQWDQEDTYYHLCDSLEGATGEVLWDAGPVGRRTQGDYR